MRQCLALVVLIVCVTVVSPGWAATVEVTVRNFEFDEAVVEIQPGDTVVWNLESGVHSVTADDGSFLSSGPGGGFPFFHTFNSSGSFPYHCGVHPFMQGTINVGEPSTEPCVPSPTVLCLRDNRFKVEMTWRSNAANPLVSANAVPLPAVPSSGLFYFQDPGNAEMLVKVLDACNPILGNKYWVFFAATTNVEFHLTVTDTSNNEQKFYSNALNHPALPVQDTSAFATCP